MRKMTKKLLSLIMAAAMSASAFGGLSALADGVTFDLDETDSTARTATLIKATYDGDVLSDVKIINNNIAIAAGQESYEVPAEEVEAGVKYFLWDMTSSKMTPLAEAVETTPDPNATPKPTPEVTPAPEVTSTPEVTQAPGGDDEDSFIPENPIKTWKLDFGAEGSTPAEGYTRVTPKSNYTGDTATVGYGLIGNNENDYKFNGNRADGFEQQQGQVIELQAGGGTGLYDGIGVVGEDASGNQADKYYPVRFALKVADNTYYRVRATVTTLDPDKDAVASLYTERKHPLYTEKTIPAGTTVVTDFTVRPTPIDYRKSDPKGTMADEMVNIALLGENAALAALEIYQVESAPVLWVLGDSTVTDGGGPLPFWPLQQCTGVGTGITKYLPGDIAMVNEGEGGLNANDNTHFNIAKEQIRAGDYMWVEYGHNHKHSSDAPAASKHTGEWWRNDYVQALKKYYEACKNAKGDGTATLVIVGPIDRINNYNAETNTWGTSLAQFSTLGKQYVDVLMYGGETEAQKFLDKWAEVGAFAETNKVIDGNSVTISADKQAEADALIAAADAIVEAAVAAGEVKINNVAFVDLNKPSLDFYGSITEKAKVKDVEVTNDKRLINFYFQTSKGGGTDTTHPNDAGAENLAYEFFKTADDTAYPALAPLLARYKAGKAEPPTLVSEDVVNMGFAPNDAWPYYQQYEYAYPLVIKDVTANEENPNILESVVVYAQAQPSGYVVAVLEILDADGNVVGGKYVTNHIDASNNIVGSTFTLSFSAENLPTLTDGQTYKAYAWPITMSDNTLIPEGEELEGVTGKRLSAVYTPTEIDEILITNEDKNGIEDFNYYGKAYDGTAIIDGINDWVFVGSAQVKDITIAEEDGLKYLNLKTNGVNANSGAANKGSFYLHKDLSKVIGTTGRYMISADMKYVSGGGMDIGFVKGLNKNQWGTGTLIGFTINSEGYIKSGGHDAGQISANKFTNITYTIDMDLGVATISVAGADPVTYEVENYTRTDTAFDPDQLEAFWVNASNTAVGAKLANLTVAKLKSKKLPQYNLEVKSADANKGSVQIVQAEETGEAVTQDSAQINTVMTVKATPNSGYVFANWTNKEGTVVSTDAEYKFRLREDTTLTANFVGDPGVEDIVSYTLEAEQGTVKAVNGATVQVNIANAVDNAGTAVAKATNADAQWSVEPAVGVTVVDGLVTIGEDFDMGEDETKTITVKATLNNIERTTTIIAHIYDYYEDFNANDLTKTAWFAHTSDGGSYSVTNGELNLVGGSKNNTYGGIHFMTQEEAVDKIVTITYDYTTSKVATGNDTSHLFFANLPLTTKNPTYSNSTASVQNLSEGGLAFTAGKKYTVTIVINNKDKTAAITAEPALGSGAAYTIKEIKAAINCIYFRPGKSITDKIDNFKVTIAEAPETSETE